MRTLFAAAFSLSLSLSPALYNSGARAGSTEAHGGEDGGLAHDLSMDHYKDIARRFPERLGFVCWVAYEMYKSGDFQNAQELFEMCAERKHALSMIFLSQIHMDGLGVAKDPAAATDWMRRAAETGYGAGQYNYGLVLLQGAVTPRDPEAGKDWIRKAAAQGDSDAQALVASDFDLAVVPAGLGRPASSR